MRQYFCSVRIGGSTQHVTANKLVTIAEIAVLRKLHGNDAIADIRPAKGADGAPLLGANEDGRPRSDAEERARLAHIYDIKLPGDESSPLITELFGPYGSLPRSLREIGVDPNEAARALREQIKNMEAQASALADEEDAFADEDAAFDELDEVPEPPVAKRGKKADVDAMFDEAAA